MLGTFDLGAIVGRLVLDKQQWTQSIQGVRADLKDFKKDLKAKTDEIQAAGRMLVGFGAGVTASFGVLIKSAADAGDVIHDLAEKTGISTEMLSGYKLAADKSGTSLDDLAIGFKILANQMQAAHDTGGAQKRLFDSLGVSFEDAEGKLRPLDAVMLDVADMFERMPGGAMKSSLSVDLFGRSAQNLIPFLNLGRAGLEAEYRAAERLGLVFSQEAADGADAFNDSLTELRGAAQGLAQELGKSLLPALKPMIDNMKESVRWVREFVKDYPGFSSALAMTGAAVGVIAGVLGTVCILLPSFLKGWVLLYPVLVAAAPIVTAIGAAWAGWELGKWYGEVTGLNRAIQDQISSGKGVVAWLLQLTGIMPKVNAQIAAGTGHADAYAIQLEAIARASELIGHKVTGFMEAQRILRLEFERTGTVGNAALDGWLGRLPKLKGLTDGVKSGLDALLATFNIKTKTALTEELKLAEEALKKLQESSESTPGSIQKLETEINRLKVELLGATHQIDMARSSLQGLEADFKSVAEAFNDNLEKLLAPGIPTEIIEISPLDMNLEGLAADADAGLAILDEFNAAAAASVAAASEKARQDLAASQQLYNQVFGDIINGFTSIMDGSKTMGEAFSGVITTMIADLGKLVIAEIMAAKKSIVAEQMKSVAHAIAGIFKSIPWFLAIPLAAGAFAVVSKLFSGLMKFEQGGVFKEPTVAEVGHGTEYLLPEKKLIRIVQDAMTSTSSGMGASPATATAGGPTIQPTFHVHMTVKSLDGRTVREARELIFQEFSELVRSRGWGDLRLAVRNA